MSGQVIGALYDLQLTRQQREVAIAFADHADEDGGSVYPSIERIAWKIGVHRRTVQRYLRDLRDLGVMRVEVPATPRRPAHYRFDLGAVPRRPPFRTNTDEVPSATEDGDAMPSVALVPSESPFESSNGCKPPEEPIRLTGTRDVSEALATRTVPLPRVKRIPEVSS